MELKTLPILNKQTKFMANIINIETSARRCSVALGIEGQVEGYWEEIDTQSRNLAHFVEKALEALSLKELHLDAVSVSIGPGSYTGLRAGLSLAKGVCLARDCKLIEVPTLMLLAVSAMFKLRECEGNEIFIPMIDARRMEVYTAAYNSALEELMPPIPMILEPESLVDLETKGKRIFIGDGTTKFREIAVGEGVWLTSSSPSANDMAILSEKFYREGRFADVAYAVPVYLKEYNAKISKNKVLSGLQNSSKE